MYKFIITLQRQPGTRDEIVARAPEVQAATQAEPGCVAYDFFTCTDDPDQEAHEAHLEQEHTKSFIAFHEPKHRAFSFETLNVEP